MELELYCPGLRGVIAGETDICRLDGGMAYRGFCIVELATESTFLEVAYLLLFEELPNEEQYADFISIIAEESVLPPSAQEILSLLPLHSPILQSVATGLSIASHYDAQSEEPLSSAAHSQAIRILAQLPLLIGTCRAQREQVDPPKLDPDASYVSNLYRMFTGRRPTVLQEKALEIALIVSAEHEFNPATFVSRIVASTDGNMFRAVSAAFDTAAGWRGAGGDDRVLTTLDAVGSPERADAFVRSRRLENVPIPGFGHPVYHDYDPRAALLETQCERLARACGRSDLEELASSIERSVWEQLQLPPNIDWPLARLLSYLEISPDLFRLCFTAGRVLGWMAHAIEQSGYDDIIRPRARYRGVPPRDYVPMRHR